MKFTGVELTGNSGNPVDITFTTPKTIDLLNQSGMASAVLFTQPIPAGDYGQAFTCQVALDNPDQADTAVKFTLTPIKTGITVVAKQTPTVDIP